MFKSILGRSSQFFLGLFSGAMLIIAFGMMSCWSTLAPQEYRSSFQTLGPYLGSFMVPLMVLSILCSGLALFLARDNRLPWAVAFASVLLIVPLYGIVHAPVNGVLLGSNVLSADSIIDLRDRWFLWHWVRTAMGVIAFASALSADAKPGSH